MERHAVYATTQVIRDDRQAQRVCFRVGQPTTLGLAHARHERLAGTGSTFLHGRVRHERRFYPIDFYEVRAVDRHGRGLGSERHSTAIPIPYRSHHA